MQVMTRIIISALTANNFSHYWLETIVMTWASRSLPQSLSTLQVLYWSANPAWLSISLVLVKTASNILQRVVTSAKNLSYTLSFLPMKSLWWCCTSLRLCLCMRHRKLKLGWPFLLSGLKVRDSKDSDREIGSTL